MTGNGMKMVAAFVALIAPVAMGAMPVAAQAPYAGQEGRRIAALSPADIDDLLAGRGWGFAKPAELNGYPGPSHVLDLAEALALSEDQVATISEIRARMEGQARRLGADYVAAEARLDAAFEAGGLEPSELRALTGAAAEIEAELRAVHLAAHLETTPVLTPRQIAAYARARGYAGPEAAGDHAGGHGAAQGTRSGEGAAHGPAAGHEGGH